jgi:hypothetical protein
MSYEITILVFPLWCDTADVIDPDEARLPPRPATNSPRRRPLRFSLKLLGAYAVGIVNGAAVIYILVKVGVAVRALFQSN